VESSKFRKHIRLPDYDYSSPGWYFVTLCTKGGQPVFAPKISEKYGYGKSIVAAPSHSLESEFDFVAATLCVANSPKRNSEIFIKVLEEYENTHKNVLFDFYCIMPDHVHLIVDIEDKIEKIGEAQPRSYRIGTIVGALKGMSSRVIGKSIWQQNFYEHIIRSESSLDRIRNYIFRNPQSLVQDWSKIDPKPV